MSDLPERTPAAAVRMPWSLPALRELPKLTQLTLASAIGGGGGTGGGGSTVFGLLLAALALAGCASDRMVAPSEGDLPLPSVALNCLAEVATSQVTCRGPSSAPGQEILGGQGIRVVLRAANVAYDGASDFTFDVSVQNLAPQPIGTDGVSATGIYVFFEGPPAVSTGAGAITVDNEDGSALFTSGSQDYYFYTGSLAAGATSAPRPWRFLVDPGVTTFSFTVLVAADVFDQGGLLQWRKLPGLNRDAVADVAANSASDAMAVGWKGATTRWDGTTATRLVPITEEYLQSVAALGNGKYVAVGLSGGVYRFDGKVWSKVYQHSGGGSLEEVYASSDTLIVAIGGSNVVVYSGGVYTEEAGPGSGLRFVSGIGNMVYGISGGGLLYQRLGTAWAPTASIPLAPFQFVKDFRLKDAGTFYVASFDFTANVGHVDALTLPSTVTPVYARPDTVPVGLSFGAGDTLVVAVRIPNAGFPGSQLLNIDLADVGFATTPRTSMNFGQGLTGLSRAPDNSYWAASPEHGFTRYQGASFYSPDPAVATQYRGVWGTGNKAWIITDGMLVWRVQGDLSDPEFATPGGLTSIWGLSATELYAGAPDGTIWQGNGAGGWTQDLGFLMPDTVRGIWGDPGTGTLFAVGGGNLSRRFGGVWTDVLPGFPFTIRGVWGCGPDEAWAVGDNGFVFHYLNGGLTLVSLLPQALYAVTGTSCTDVWVAGDAGALWHWDGTTWTDFQDGSNSNVRSLAARAPGEVYAGAPTWVTLATTSSLGLHLPHPSTSSIDGLWRLGNGELVAVGQNTVLRGTR